MRDQAGFHDVDLGGQVAIVTGGGRGLGRAMALTLALIGSPEDERWFGGRMRKRIQAGEAVPPEHAAELVRFLASGRADSLSGCYLDVGDNVAEMAERAGEIHRDELYRLRLRR